VGDGAATNQAFFSLNDFIAAEGGTNYLPLGTQQFTAQVLGGSQQVFSQTYSVAFPANFSAGSATPETLNAGWTTTLPASAITANSVTLNASVNPNGVPAAVYFQWGATASYGNFTGTNTLTTSLNTAQAVAMAISGLLPGTTIHYQVVAVSSTGDQLRRRFNRGNGHPAAAGHHDGGLRHQRDHGDVERLDQSRGRGDDGLL
jgi:phosphodiesterase/alkaline phosphatase D-like protein